MCEWKPYIDDRVIARRDDYYVIKPVDHVEPTPLWCPVCESLFVSDADAAAYERFTCCEWCANTWAYKNSDAWLKGWRPSGEEVSEKLTKRVVSPISFE